MRSAMIRRFVVVLGHVDRCRGPAQFLRPAPGRGGPPLRRPRHSRTVEGYRRPARARRRLCHALSRSVPRGGRTLPRLHAGRAGRGEMADRAAGALGAGGRKRAAASRLGGRSRDPGARAGNDQRSGRAAARGLARAGVGRAAAGGGAEPARPVGAHGHDPIWSWPALFAFADQSALARDLVHADRMERGALRAADRARLVFALSRGLGAHRGDAVGAVRRRAHGGSDQAGLPRDPRAPRQTPAGAGARAGAGAFAGHLNTYARPRGSGDPVQIKDLDSRWSLPRIGGGGNERSAPRLFWLTRRLVAAVAWDRLRRRT